MNQHPGELLSAYYDGELHGAAERQVAEHVNSCPQCQAELEQMGGLSSLLQSVPVAERRTSPERFAANVNLRLPRRQPIPASLNGWRLGWQAVPLALIGTWVFSQITLALAGGALLLGLSSSQVQAVLEPLNAWGILQGPGDSGWTEVLAELLQAIGLDFSWLSASQSFLTLIFINLGLTLVLGALLWSWMAAWWASRQVSNPER